MNINIQNKTAKEAGVLKEIEKPLDPTVSKIFCWDVALLHEYGNDFQDIDFLIIRNSLTGYSILVPYVKILFHDIFKIIEKFIQAGINLLNLDKEIVDYYFKEAGRFYFGIISNTGTVQSLRENAFVAYIDIFEAEEERFNTFLQQQGFEFVTEEFNSRPIYLKDGLTYSQYMKDALIDLYNKNLKGYKAYELLITLDLESYKVTRRIVVPADISFYDLYKILVEVFGWWDIHQSRFDFFKEPPDSLNDPNGDFILNKASDETNETINNMGDYKLSDLMEDYSKIYWTYDFGDCWIHDIEIFNTYDDYQGEAPYLLYAHYCVPPEDVGGVEGFKKYLKVIRNPRLEDYKTAKDWRKWRKNLTKKKRTPHKISYDLSERENG